MDGVASLPLKCIASAARTIFASQAGGVLILVLMEYGLRVEDSLLWSELCPRLNPCFNGIWSASMATNEIKVSYSVVIILVLMEYGLRELIYGVV